MDTELFKGTSETNPLAPGHDPYTRELAADIAGKKKVLIDLTIRADLLTKKDIAAWRRAWQMAISVDYPRRHYLYDIYTDCLIDLHLSGAIRQRASGVVQKKFSIIDINSKKEDEVATEIFEKRWFKHFMLEAIDCIFWGPTLVEFKNLQFDPMRFEDVEVVPRKHVLPEFGVFVKDQHDNPNKGIDYTKPPYNNWTMLLKVRDVKDLGLLLKLAPQCIAKKNVLAFWDKFSEIFGMPIRFATSSERDARNRGNIENMLENMGSAAWGLFPEGTDIQLIETSRGDAFKVYDARIDRANSEISKGVLGQTMTMDDGSSKSQSETHGKQLSKIEVEDADFVRDLVNEKLIPLLIRHGFPLTGKRFEWVENDQYSAAEQIEIERMILDHYEVDPKYFMEKYGINVTGRRATPAPAQLNAGESGFFANAIRKGGIIEKLNLDYSNCTCTHCGGSYQLSAGAMHHIVSLLADPELDAQAEAVAKAVFDGTFKGDIDPAMAKRVAEKLADAISQGFGKDIATIATGDVDYAMIQNLTKNVYQFSAAKNYKQLRELTDLVRDGDRLREWKEFRDMATELNNVFNKKYLRTEYELAVSGSQNASRWVSQDEESSLQYRTANDENVRDSHRALDGVVKKKTNPFWDVYYPPNGYRCRCLAVEVSDRDDTADDKISTPEVPAMFRTNLAKHNLIFPKDHPYWEGVPGEIIDNAQDLLK